MPDAALLWIREKSRDVRLVGRGELQRWMGRGSPPQCLSEKKKADQVLMMKYETTAFTVHERQSDVMDVRKSES